MRTLLVDNYDSFTYNLHQLLTMVNGVEPVVVKNDHSSWTGLDPRTFDNVIISPGPGTPQRPEDIGIAAQIIQEARLPTLGVCLGHQAICHFHGATISHAPIPMHGRVSEMHHNGDELFAGIPKTFSAVRYHSLAAFAVSAALEPIAYTDDDLLMAVRHRELPLWGVQFHPESVASEYGYRLLENFRDLTRKWHGGRSAVRSPNGDRSERVVATVRSPVALTVRLSEIDEWVDPPSVFVKQFSDSENAFWLDSALTTDGAARFSYMGDASGPLAEVIRCDVAGEGLTRTSQNGTEVISGPLFSYLDERMKNVCVRADTPFSFQLGFVGYLGYEAKSETGGARSFVSQTPDAMLLFADRMIVFDHLQRRLYLVAFDHASTDVWFDGMHSALSTIEQSDDFAVVDLRDDDWSNESLYMRHSREQYLELIDRCQERIRDGESYEICLTNTFEFSPLEDPLATYLTLRSQNAAPMASYLRFSSLSILSASPERLVRVEEEGRVEAKPIKGTVRRGVTVDEDFELREHLCQDEKSRAENLMIVDLLRNDLGRVCVPGSVAVPSLFAIETFATLHHLVSTIVGKLDAQRSAVDCLRSIFPGGSMTGAPKIRTMQILDELETGPRGVYSGAIGYLSLNGSMDWSVVIRTIVNREHSATVGVGGAITALSDPDAEFDEMMLKATALRRAMMAGRGHLVGGVHASKA